MAISLMHLFPEEAEALIPRFEAAAESFLSSFGEDGYCLEGPMYWAYGFGFFTALAERLRSFCGIDLFQNAKVERIAAFFQKVFLCQGVEVTFADADLGTKYNHGILHFLHSEYPDTVQIPPARHGSYTDRIARMCLHLRSFLWFDPGRAQYCRDYFQAATRYDFFHTSSRGHSVPIVGSSYQKPGREFVARETSWGGKTFSMELAGAYDMEGLRNLRRSFALADSGVTLTDHFDTELPVTERFISPEEPTVAPALLRWNDTEVTFSPAVLPSVTRTENPIEGDKVQTLYLIDIPLPPATKAFTAQIR